MKINSWTTKKINICIKETKLKRDSISITSLELQNKDIGVWFIIILNYLTQEIKNNIDLAFGIFYINNINRIKLIRIQDIDELIDEEDLLNLANAENTFIYFGSSVEKNNISDEGNFIGIEIRTKKKLDSRFFGDFIKIRLSEEIK